jgi:hypothetical protein
MRIVMLVAAAAVSAMIAAPVGASTPSKKSDGTKVICRTIDELGSRLASKRVCLTRDQWREQKDNERQNLEKAQRIRVGQDIQ